MRSPFFKPSFANKLVIYDPLDRPIPREGENQALKQTDFVDTLNKQHSVTTQNLLYPLDQKHIDSIEIQFKGYFQECMDISNMYIEIARKEKNEFNRDFSLEPKVSSFHDICEIFCHNKLLVYKK